MLNNDWTNLNPFCIVNRIVVGSSHWHFRWLTLMTAPFKTDERFSNFDFTNDILMYVLAYWVLNYFADAWLKLIDSYYSIRYCELSICILIKWKYIVRYIIWFIYNSNEYDDIYPHYLEVFRNPFLDFWCQICDLVDGHPKEQAKISTNLCNQWESTVCIIALYYFDSRSKV